MQELQREHNLGRIIPHKRFALGLAIDETFERPDHLRLVEHVDVRGARVHGVDGRHEHVGLEERQIQVALAAHVRLHAGVEDGLLAHGPQRHVHGRRGALDRDEAKRVGRIRRDVAEYLKVVDGFRPRGSGFVVSVKNDERVRLIAQKAQYISVTRFARTPAGSFRLTSAACLASANRSLRPRRILSFSKMVDSLPTAFSSEILSIKRHWVASTARTVR